EDDVEQGGVEVSGDGLARHLQQLVQIGALLSVAPQLLHRHQALGAVELDAEGRAATELKGRVTGLDRGFDVLRVEVATLEDDHILDAAGDVQVIVEEEAEIAAAQELTLVRAIDACLKHLARELWLVPVAGR